MAKLVATLGTSPGGVLETFLYLIKQGVEIDEIRVITTTNPEVEKAWKIVKIMFICCVKEKYPNVIISKHPVEMDDINNEEDLIKFKNFIEKQIGEGDYVDITGGRKGMSVAAALAAKKKGAKITTSIISQDSYREINNRIRELKNIPELQDRAQCVGEIKNTYCNLISDKANTILFDI